MLNFSKFIHNKMHSAIINNGTKSHSHIQNENIYCFCLVVKWAIFTAVGFFSNKPILLIFSAWITIAILQCSSFTLSLLININMFKLLNSLPFRRAIKITCGHTQTQAHLLQTVLVCHPKNSHNTRRNANFVLYKNGFEYFKRTCAMHTH